ncbi:hypothetical protein HLB23_23795 [Nocardia uniformis]|uniref:Uncharacterized protein n=1 Tax=Nocardia uniformis TaxID=53432 RepID=A0A849C278_9NOCA|nr:hypothetical protein [Nocardia uniformis]NNH72843.1 hypothetical protein [Nocardia uniformis]
MQRSALLLVATAGIILAGTGATELLGDESGPPPAMRNLSQQQQHYVIQSDSGALQPAACVKLASGRYGIQTSDRGILPTSGTRR